MGIQVLFTRSPLPSTIYWLVAHRRTVYFRPPCVGHLPRSKCKGSRMLDDNQTWLSLSTGIVWTVSSSSLQDSLAHRLPPTPTPTPVGPSKLWPRTLFLIFDPQELPHFSPMLQFATVSTKCARYPIGTCILSFIYWMSKVSCVNAT
jgi:hypothetical protein